jgi:DNA-binding LacI/PurR family transcriptional regulator
VVFFWYEKPTFSDFYLARVLDGITNFLSEKKYNILMNTFSRQIGQEHVYTHFVNSGLMDGILAIAPPVESTFFHDLKQGVLPYVLINYQVNDPQVCFVDCLNTQGVIDSVDHLLGLGHKRIGLISGDIQFSKSNLDRYNAFKFILKKRNLAYREDHVFFGNWTEETGAKAVEAFWKTKSPPTALLAADDVIALGAIRELEKKGLKVPKDVAVIGFDDLPFQTTLTTVHQPVFEMGYEAARMLWNQIEKKPLEYTHRLFPMKLVVRESCGFYQQEPRPQK